MSSGGPSEETVRRTRRRDGAAGFFWTASRRASAERLRFATQSWSPLTIVIGPAGCGKTSLIAETLRQFEFREAVGVVWDPEALERDPSTSLADAFREAQASEEVDKVLIIDGAQNLPVATLEDICRLIESPGLRLILVGRPTLLDHVRGTPGAPLGPFFEIPDFTWEETGEYAESLLAIALNGTERSLGGTLAGAIYARSDGKPGAIREICKACIAEIGQGNDGALDADFIRRLPLGGKVPAFPKTSEQISSSERPPGPAPGGKPEPGPRRPPRQTPGRGDDAPPPPEPLAKTPVSEGFRAQRILMPLALGAAGFLVAMIIAEGPRVSETVAAVTGVDPAGWFAEQTTGEGSTGIASPEDLKRHQRNVHSVSGLPEDHDALLRSAIEMADNQPDASLVALARSGLGGNARAAYFLGQMFEAGEGVSVDYARARAWYAIAAGEIDRAAARIAALPVPEADDALTAPAPLYSTLSGGVAELVWTSRDGSDPHSFIIEVREGSGVAEIVADNIETSAAFARVPDTATEWRVIAVGGNGTAASPWFPLIPPPLPASDS